MEDVQDVRLFQHVMAVNFFGSMYCTKSALTFLKETQCRIVAISSVASLTGVPAHSAYCASKHAMNGFFESLRIELAGTRITVTIGLLILCNPKFMSEVSGQMGNLSGGASGTFQIYNRGEMCGHDREGDVSRETAGVHILERTVGPVDEISEPAGDRLDGLEGGCRGRLALTIRIFVSS